MQRDFAKNYREAGKAGKRPSTTLSSLMDVKVEPLFSLPDYLLDPSGCKRFRQKIDTATIIKERDKKFYENSYTGKRLRREKFRRYMVGVIVKPEMNEEGIDLNNDRDINRYYYYIRNGIDTIHVMTIDEETIAKIKNLIPPKLAERFNNSVELLMDEVSDDFVGSIKKAIVEFSLGDPFKEQVFDEVGFQQ